METPTPLQTFMESVNATIDVIKDGIALFIEPPLVWFVALALGVAGINVAKKLIPRKRG